MMGWTPLDDPRVEALVSWSAGDEQPDVAAALASLTDMPPRPDCAVALGAVAVKAYERVPRVGARNERLGNALVAVLGRLGASGAAELERLWDRTGYVRPRARIRAALAVARRDAARGHGIAAVRSRDEPRASVAVGAVEAVLTPSPDMRRVRTTWRGADGRVRASRPAAAARASAGEHARLAAERKRLQAELTSLRAELDVELLRGTPVTLEQWVARWFSDPLRGAAARRMIWAFDDVLALPAEDRLRDVGGEAVESRTTALVTLWHPASTGLEVVAAWREGLARLGVTQPVEQAARDVVGRTQFAELCDDIGWLDQTRMRAFLRGRGWRVPWLGRFFQVPEARRELFAGGPSAVLGLEWREDDGRVTPAWLAFESTTEEMIHVGDLPACWLSEIGRDVLGAAAAARI
jgi:hypothetical protein